MYKTVEIQKCYCDFCGREIEMVEDWCRECGVTTRSWPIYRTKAWNTKDLFEHLCKRCAGNLDKALGKMQDDLVKREKIMMRNKALNEQRKERLGTKG